MNWRFPDIYTQVERGLPSEPKQTHVGDGEFFLDGVEDARKFARQMKADSN